MGKIKFDVMKSISSNKVKLKILKFSQMLNENKLNKPTHHTVAQLNKVALARFSFVRFNSRAIAGSNKEMVEVMAAIINIMKNKLANKCP